RHLAMRISTLSRQTAKIQYGRSARKALSQKPKAENELMKNHTSKHLFFLLVILLASASMAAAQGVPISTKEEIQAAVEAVPCDQDARLEGVKKLFTAAGAEESDMKVEEFKKGKVRNLVVTKKVSTGETFIVGAHYDRADDGCGVVDNWTGIVVLANIYRSMAPTTTHKTYKFVAFDAEEKGLVGSAQMVKAMTDQ